MKTLSQSLDNATCLYINNAALSTQGINHPSQETVQELRPTDDEKGAIITNQICSAITVISSLH